MGLESQPLAQPAKLLLSLALLCLLASACEEPLKAPAERTGEPESPSLIFDGFRARGSYKGVTQWEALASRAQVYNSSQTAKADEVEITYFQGAKVVSKARADHADIDLKNYDIIAVGNVLVHGQNGVILATDKLDWDNGSQQVSTKSWVKVWRGHSVLTGRGLVADRRLEHVEVQEDVKVDAANLKELRAMRGSAP